MRENFVRMIMYHCFMRQKVKSLKFVGSKNGYNHFICLFFDKTILFVICTTIFKRIIFLYSTLKSYELDLTSFTNWFKIMWVRFSIMTLAYIEFEENEMRIESKSYLISLTNWFKTCDLVLKIFPLAQT